MLNCALSYLIPHYFIVIHCCLSLLMLSDAFLAWLSRRLSSILCFSWCLQSGHFLYHLLIKFSFFSPIVHFHNSVNGKKEQRVKVVLEEGGNRSLWIIKWRVYSSQIEEVEEIAITILN